MGRPPKYLPRFCEDIIEFFNVLPYVKKKVIILRKGVPVEVEIDVASDWPTLAGFAAKLEVNRDSLQEWAKKYPEFSVAIKKAKEIQENILVTNSLKGLYAQPFAIFAAKNVLNWKDRQEIIGDKENPVRFIQVREMKEEHEG